ncbi:MAG: peptidase MA family metallohydrolase [Elusimicrobiota bacterium]
MKKKIFTVIIIILFISPFVYCREDYSQLHKLIISWQIEQASDLMEDSQDVPPYIKGLYEFYTGNYKKALKYFNRSSPKPDEWIKRCRNTIATAKNFKNLDTEYFTVRYTGKDKVLAMYLKDFIDDAARRVYEKFGWKPDNRKIILEIYPTRDSFKKASTLTDGQIKVSGAIAICKFNRLMIASPKILTFGYHWPQTITHEYIHLIVGKITGLENMPLWFNEGLAKFYEDIWGKHTGKISPVARNYIIDALKTDTDWVDLGKMKYGMPTLDSSDEVKLGFAQVHAMTKYIKEKYSEESIKDILYLLKDKTANRAFGEIIKKTGEELFKEWKNYIKNASLTYTAGATLAGYSFKEEKEDPISRYVAHRAETDLRLAGKFEKREKYNLSIKKYKDALEKDEGNHVIFNRLGRVQLKAEKLEAARESLTKSIMRNPDYAPPYIHLGELYLMENNYSKAEENLLKYVYRSPFNPRVHKMLLEVYKKTGNREKRDREAKIKRILDGS